MIPHLINLQMMEHSKNDFGYNRTKNSYAEQWHSFFFPSSRQKIHILRKSTEFTGGILTEGVRPSVQ